MMEDALEILAKELGKTPQEVIAEIEAACDEIEREANESLRGSGRDITVHD